MRRKSKHRVLLGALLLALALPFVPDLALAGPGGPAQIETHDKANGAARARRRARRKRRIRARARATRRWHRRAPSGAIRRWMREDPSPLVLRPVHSRKQFVIEPESDEGGFEGRALAEARRALADDDGGTHRIHPRLLDIVYEAQRRFRAPWVVVISGYRDDRATSRHTHGRAIDLVLPGVSDRRLAHWLTRQGFVGVGLYTRSGFVHLDVRHRSHFWMDYSWPGQRSRSRPVFRKRAVQMDARAARRGEEQVSRLRSLPDIDDE